MTLIILAVLIYLAICSAAARYSLWRDDEPIDYRPSDEWDGGPR